EFLIDAHRGEVLESRDGRFRFNPDPFQSVWDCSRNCSCTTNLRSSVYNYTFGRSGPTAPERGPNPIYGYSDVDNIYELLGDLREYYGTRFGRFGANDLGGMGDGISVAPNESRAYTYYDACSANVCANGNAWLSLTPL